MKEMELDFKVKARLELVLWGCFSGEEVEAIPACVLSSGSVCSQSSAVMQPVSAIQSSSFMVNLLSPAL